MAKKGFHISASRKILPAGPREFFSFFFPVMQCRG